MDWAAIIKKIAPKAKASIVNSLAENMPQVIETGELVTNLRIAHFLAQLAHESAGFTTTEEFASGAAYEGRKDLGNTQRGDGKRFKGRGLIQLTGRHNYKIYGEKLGVNLVADPPLAGKFPWAALTAALYWKERKINRPADRDDVKSVTKIINGGFNGLSDRQQYLERAKQSLIFVPAPLPERSNAPKAEIAAMQTRLTELNYPTGGSDGVIGPLTRSAIRDFQDAHNLVVNGRLDRATIALLESDDAQPRPIPPERAALTAADLRDRGSKIIAAADETKYGTAGAALATVAGVASEAKEVAAQLEDIKTGIESGAGAWEIARDYWPAIVIVLAAVAVAYFLWRAYRGAKTVEDERVDNARKGINLRV